MRLSRNASHQFLSYDLWTIDKRPKKMFSTKICKKCSFAKKFAKLPENFPETWIQFSPKKVGPQKNFSRKKFDKEEKNEKERETDGKFLAEDN